MRDYSAVRLPFVSLLLLVAAGLSLTVDVAFSHAVSSWEVRGDIRKSISLSEAFAHGFGVAMILVALVVLDRENWLRVFRIATCAYGAGLLANLFKLCFPRTRPYVSSLEESVFETFRAPFFSFQQSVDNLSGTVIQSFPSGHTATAVGLAFGLSFAYPRGKWLFGFLAALAAFQRVEALAHFLSDVFGGAAIGCATATICHDKKRLGKLFDHLESRRKSTAKESGNGPRNRPRAAPSSGTPNRRAG